MRTRISQVYAICLIAIILFSGNYWESKIPIVSTILFFIGMVLAAIGSMGRLWCLVYIAGYKDESLITVGPYSITRNPLYFFSLLGALGVGFASETFLIPLLVLMAFAVYYPAVIRDEQRRLKGLHAGDFEQYISKVPVFFPRFSNFIEPENYNVRPILFRKNIFDALWFIWLIGFLELFEAFHHLNILPTLFYIF